MHDAHCSVATRIPLGTRHCPCDLFEEFVVLEATSKNNFLSNLAQTETCTYKNLGCPCGFFCRDNEYSITCCPIGVSTVPVFTGIQVPVIRVPSPSRLASKDQPYGTVYGTVTPHIRLSNNSHMLQCWRLSCVPQRCRPFCVLHRNMGQIVYIQCYGIKIPYTAL